MNVAQGHPAVETAAGIAALVLIVPFVVLLVGMAVRWKDVRGAKTREEVVRVVLGRRGAAVFWTVIGVGAVVIIGFAIAVNSSSH